MNRNVIVRVILSLMIICVGSQAIAQQDSSVIYHEGRQMFRTHCASCHDVHKDLVGPALASTTKKHRSEWLFEFIHDSQRVIVHDDPYAAALYNAYQFQVMPSFRKLSLNDINKILAYIDRESVHPDEKVESNYKVITEGSPEILRGKQLFQSHCLTCHQIPNETFGTALASVTRRHSKEWLVAFVRSSTSVIDSGDLYATHLFERFDKRPMVDLEFLSDEEIGDIFSYIEFASSSPSWVGGVNGRGPRFSNRRAVPMGGTESRVEQRSPFFRTLQITMGGVAAAILVLLAGKVVRGINGEEKGII